MMLAGYPWNSLLFRPIVHDIKFQSELNEWIMQNRSSMDMRCETSGV